MSTETERRFAFGEYVQDDTKCPYSQAEDSGAKTRDHNNLLHLAPVGEYDNYLHDHKHQALGVVSEDDAREAWLAAAFTVAWMDREKYGDVPLKQLEAAALVADSLGWSDVADAIDDVLEGTEYERA